MKIIRTVALLALAVSSASFAATLTFTGTLSGAKESPTNASPGTGTALVILNTTAHTMEVIVDFANLTAGVTASHIHCCTNPAGSGTAGVATLTPTFTDFPSGVTSGHYDHTFDTSLSSTWNTPFFNANGGTALGAETALIAGLVAGQAYLNVHSSAFPGGEIRDFLVPTPEPATFVMGSAALGLLVFLRRRA